MLAHATISHDTIESVDYLEGEEILSESQSIKSCLEAISILNIEVGIQLSSNDKRHKILEWKQVVKDKVEWDGGKILS